MADYAKMKNAELEGLLVERGLPKTGKKADMVKRLEENDQTKSSAPAKSANEDEIDWDDEPAANDAKTTTTEPAIADAKNATSEPAAAAIAAGGIGQVPNPTAVPNQIVGEDMSNTDSLTVSKPSEEAPADADATPTVESTTEASAPAEEKKELVDFSSGIAKTTLDQEIEKRKARAKKFGLDVEKDETLKNLERAKKFGATELPGSLNEALPEKRERKRGREGGEENGDSKRRGGRGRPDLGGRRGSSRRNTPRSGTPNKSAGAAAAPQAKAAGGGGGARGMSEADKAKAESRRARFAS